MSKPRYKLVAATGVAFLFENLRAVNPLDRFYLIPRSIFWAGTR